MAEVSLRQNDTVEYLGMLAAFFLPLTLFTVFCLDCGHTVAVANAIGNVWDEYTGID